MKEERETIKEILHYPECWDTACYSTLESAIIEVLNWYYLPEIEGKCGNRHKCYKKKTEGE